MKIKNPPWPTHGMKASLGTALLLASQVGFAGTITVDSSIDAPIVDNASGCTLREAIIAANTNLPLNGCAIDIDGPTAPNDAIVFSGVSTILLSDGELTIEDLSGGTTLINGGDGVTISADNPDAPSQDVIFGINSETALDSLTMTGANLVDGNGGAIFSSAPLTIMNSSIVDNAVSGVDEDSMVAARGGGIFTTADLTLIDTNMSGNFAPRAGGAIEVDGTSGNPIEVTITGGTFSQNVAGNDAQAAPGNGGVLHVSDTMGDVTVDIEGASFTDNSAFLEGGALWNGAGTMIVDGVTITGNTAAGPAADDGGGGIFNNGGDLRVRSTVAATLIDGNMATGASGSGGGIFNNEGDLAIDFSGAAAGSSGVTISNNLAPRAGGGIESRNGRVLIRGVTLSGNIAGEVPVDGGGPIAANPGNGGGVHISGTGVLSLFSSLERDRRNTVINNVAANEGGGLWFNIDGGAVNDSDITGNEAAGPDAVDGGGGIFHNAGNDPDPMVTDDTVGGIVSISNSVISSNSATGTSGSGGGIFVNDGGTVNVSLSAIAQNTANRAGGGIETAGGDSNTRIVLQGVALSGNVAGPDGSANPGNGGGIHISGNATSTEVSLSLVTDNVAALEGGGLWNQSGSTMFVDTTSLLRNVAAGEDAPTSESNPNPDNPSGSGGGAIFDNGGTTEIASSRILLNSATGAAGSGGGIMTLGNLAVRNSTIAANTANRAGGGIENNGGDVSLQNVNLGGTDAGSGNLGGNNPGNGGGLHTTGAGNVTVDNSLVGYNTTGNEGGGLWNSSTGSLAVTNSTVSNNQASDDGGGLYQDGTGEGAIGDSFINFSTIAQNSAGGNGGGVGSTNVVDISVTNSIVAENSAGGPDQNVAADGNISVQASTVGDDGGFNGMLRLYGPEVEDQGNGAQLPTAVHPLLSDTAARNAAGACHISLDQRNVQRPDGDPGSAGDCDNGAFELADIPAVMVTNTNSAAVTVTDMSEDVVVLGLQAENTAADSVNIGGFSGTININRLPVNVDLTALASARFDVYEDSNANGQLDEGEQTLDGARANIDIGSLRFQVSFLDVDLAGTDSMDGDSSLAIVVVANTGGMDGLQTGAAPTGPQWQAPVLAGGALLGLLGLISVGNMRRRTRWILLIASTAMVLTACGGGGSGSGGGNGGGVQPPAPPPNPLTLGDLQFVADTVVRSEGRLIGDGLPVNGPPITIEGLPDDNSRTIRNAPGNG